MQSILMKRNIELTKEVSELRVEVERIKKAKDSEYKKLWNEKQSLLARLEGVRVINNARTQSK
jgi:hypothetical protein